MTDHAAILPTSVGPVGAIVSEPEGAAHRALILFQGGGPPCRAGVDALWARLARKLAADGVAVLRFDFAGEGDSSTAGADVPREIGWRRNTDLAIAHELAPWFRERVGLDELLVVGSCHGGRIAFDFAAEDPLVKGAFLIVPYLWNVPPDLRPDKVAARRKSMTWAGELFDRGSSNLEDRRRARESVEATADESPLDESFVVACRRILARGPAWIMIGEGDSQKPVELKRRLGADGERLEVEVVPNTVIHPLAYPEVQSLVKARLVDRLAAAAARRG